MKDLYKMQKQAREMQKQMKQLKITGMSDDENIEVIINGTQEIEDIVIKDEICTVENKRNLIRGFKQAFKDAQKKLQKEMMKDMDIDKLKGMLGQ